MKKAIAYIRISTKDQSNFSLTGQEQYIRDFATKQGYEILALFTDDGQSAKNFDRPDWKLLQQFCKDNQHQVDALIVAKYDRFSRNLKAATLQEKKLLIIEQPSQNSDKILGCAPLHTPIEHLTHLLTLLKHKTA